MIIFLLVGVVLLGVLGIAFGPPLYRRRRRQHLQSLPFPEEWHPILDRYVPTARYMPAALRRRWHEAIQVFLAEKRFIGCDGLEVTDEMRLAIAGQACLMILNRGQGGFDDVHWVLVYPTSFYVTHHDVDEAGVETVEQTLLTGESWDGGRVIIAWDEVWRGARENWEGESVVIHEFAHQLDQESGGIDGAPILPDAGSYEQWSAVLGAEYESLRAQVARGHHSLLDESGADDPGEFFAYASEVFFQAPASMLAEHPELYAQLRAYYAVDPAAWRAPD